MGAGLRRTLYISLLNLVDSLVIERLFELLLQLSMFLGHCDDTDTMRGVSSEDATH